MATVAMSGAHKNVDHTSCQCLLLLVRHSSVLKVYVNYSVAGLTSSQQTVWIVKFKKANWQFENGADCKLRKR